METLLKNKAFGNHLNSLNDVNPEYDIVIIPKENDYEILIISEQ